MTNPSSRNWGIFFHFPKTAGASLSLEMRDDHGMDLFTQTDYRRPQFGEVVRAAVAGGHRFAIDGHTSFGLHALFGLERRAYYTILRPPIERLISDFFYFHAHEIDGVFIERERRMDAFAAFVAAAAHCNHYCYGLSRYCFVKYAGDGAPGLPALETAHRDRLFAFSRAPMGNESPARLLAAATSNLSEHFFFVGASEDFEAILARLSTIFGVRLTGNKRIHVTPFKPAFADLSAATRAQLLEKTAADAKLYDFARATFDSDGDPSR